MSAGGIIIIIDSVIDSPNVSADERMQLNALRNRTALTWSERRFVLKLVKRILKGI